MCNSLYLSLSISASLYSVLHRAKRTMKNISQIILLLSLKLSHATHSLRIASKVSIVTCPMKLNYSELLFSSKVVCLFLKHLGLILAFITCTLALFSARNILSPNVLADSPWGLSLNKISLASLIKYNRNSIIVGFRETSQEPFLCVCVCLLFSKIKHNGQHTK